MLTNRIIRKLIRLGPDLSSLRRIKRKAGFLLLPRKEMICLFDKYKFKVDLSMGSVQRDFFLCSDFYELTTQMCMRKILKPGMIAFDIGAHTGFFTILMADLVGKQGKVFSFEPYQPNFILLNKNIELNSLNWVACYRLACSDKKGTATLSINPTNNGGHSLGSFANNPDVAGWDKDKLPKVTVQTILLDDFIMENSIQHIDFLKVDIEGAETLCLRGAKNTLSAPMAPIIICEVGDKAQEQFGKTEKDLRKLLYSLGYRSYFIGEKLKEFGIETPVTGLPNILFKKE